MCTTCNTDKNNDKLREEYSRGFKDGFEMAKKLGAPVQTYPNPVDLSPPLYPPNGPSNVHTTTPAIWHGTIDPRTGQSTLPTFTTCGTDKPDSDNVSVLTTSSGLVKTYRYKPAANPHVYMIKRKNQNG